jgi:hypothetical protein
VIAVAGTGVTAITSLMVFRQTLEVDAAEPVLARLQARVVGTSLAGVTGTEQWTLRTARGRISGIIALGVALMVDIAALLYAVIH